MVNSRELRKTSDLRNYLDDLELKMIRSAELGLTGHVESSVPKELMFSVSRILKEHGYGVELSEGQLIVYW